MHQISHIRPAKYDSNFGTKISIMLKKKLGDEAVDQNSKESQGSEYLPHKVKTQYLQISHSRYIPFNVKFLVNHTSILEGCIYICLIQ